MSIDPFIPYFVGIDVLAFLAIPINLALEDSASAEGAKRLVFLSYCGAIFMMCVLGMVKTDNAEQVAFIVMEAFAFATLPATIYRFTKSPRDRRPRRR